MNGDRRGWVVWDMDYCDELADGEDRVIVFLDKAEAERARVAFDAEQLRRHNVKSRSEIGDSDGVVLRPMLIRGLA